MNTRLKIAILQSGLTQRALARTLHRHESTVSKWVRGWTWPHPVIQRQIAKILKSETRTLFCPSGKPAEDAARVTEL